MASIYNTRIFGLQQRQHTKKRHGLLYNWYAVINPSCLCPEGWRVPTKDDYQTMLNSNTKPLYNSQSTEGFRVKFGGMRHMGNSGEFAGLNSYTYFYTSSIAPPDDPYFLSIYGAYSSVRLDQYSGTNPRDSRVFGLAVRCIRVEKPYLTFSNQVVQPESYTPGEQVIRPEPARPSTAADYTAVYSAGTDGTRGTKILYFVKDGVVYASDQFNNVTNRVLRHIDGEKVFAADVNTGRRTSTVLYYIVGDKVYAADLNTRARTNRVLHYIINNVVYAADAMNGSRTERRLRFIVGGERTD